MNTTTYINWFIAHVGESVFHAYPLHVDQTWNNKQKERGEKTLREIAWKTKTHDTFWLDNTGNYVVRAQTFTTC